jgi:hypothetical protein
MLGRHSKHTSKGSRSVDESGEGEHGVEWEGVEELAEEAGLKRQRLQPRVFIHDKTSVRSARMLRHSDRVRLSAAIFNESIGHGVQRGEMRPSSGWQPAILASIMVSCVAIRMLFHSTQSHETCSRV